MSLKAWLEHNAGHRLNVPYEPGTPDVIQPDEALSDAVFVREHATLGDFLRAWKESGPSTPEAASLKVVS